MNRPCGRRRKPIHRIPCSVAHDLGEVTKNYYSIIQGGVFMKPLKDYSFVRGVCHNPPRDKDWARLEKELSY